jgi:5'-nucleotidase
MNILLTNDDGILAPGLSALAEAVKDMGNISIVAPETVQSAAAHSITLNDPLICGKVELPNGLIGYSISGRPADCVKVAIVELLTGEKKPDLILSGINAGSNVGIDVFYSGTVAAAIEGAFFNIPSIAFSMKIDDKVDFGYAGKIARRVLEELLSKKIVSPSYVTNVNIPPPECGKPKGIKIVAQSTQAWSTHFDRRTDPRGRLYFWLKSDTGRQKDQPETDVSGILDGYVTVTPIKFDLTDHATLTTLSDQTLNLS